MNKTEICDLLVKQGILLYFPNDTERKYVISDFSIIEACVEALT